MRPRLRWTFIGALALLGLAAHPARGTGIDFVVARNADGKLLLSKPVAVDEPYRILPADVENLPGFYLTIEPGWDGLGVDVASEGRFALAADAQIVLRRVRFDSGFSMYDLDFNPILDIDGAEETLEGEPEVAGFVWHEHLVFGAAPDQPLDKEFSATFVLRDASGQHSDSDEFTLRFITAASPAVVPGSSGLCSAIGMIALSGTGIALLSARRRSL